MKSSLVAISFALTLADVSASAQSPTPAASIASSVPAAAQVDPRVIARVDQMGRHLRTLKHFTLHADTLADEVSVDGQRLQFAGSLDYKVSLPSALHLRQSTDRKVREYYFDGKKLTIYAPRMKYYAEIAAPRTVRQLAVALEDEVGIPMPLADLFLWGTPDASKVPIHSAQYVGPAQINGKLADHYALRQGAADWQIWIARDKAPLPLKLVITAREMYGMPSYSAELSWDTDAHVKASDLVFKAPLDTSRIGFEPVPVAMENSP